MAWPLNKKDDPPPTNQPDPNAPKEKSTAEIIAESLKPVTDSLAALRTDIDSLRNPPPKPVVQGEPTSVLDDENAAFNQRLTPILLENLRLEAKMTRTDIKNEYVEAGYGDLWKQYEKAIDEVLEGTALATPDGQGGMKRLRGDAQYVRNVADMILGRAARENGVRFRSNKFVLEDANADTPGAPRNEDTEGLSPAQLKAGAKWGISPADLKKAQSKLQVVS